MFLSFAYHQAGFTDEQWEEIPRTDRVIIRDFFLNGRDVDQTMLYNYYETDSKVRKAVKRYDLKTRMMPHFSLADFSFC